MSDMSRQNRAFTAVVRGLSSARAALRSFDVQMTEEIIATNDEYRLITTDLIGWIAPKRTGFMSEHPESQLTPRGFAFQAGYFEDTFLEQLAAMGLRPRFYPPYQEYGTRFHAAQPSVEPAFEIIAPEYTAAVNDILARSVRDFGRKQ